MKRIWGRACLAVGLAMSIIVSSAAADSTTDYRSYTEHSLTKQDGTYWTWGGMQPVPVQIHGLGDVAAVHDEDLIQLTDGTVHYAGPLKAGQPVQPVALPQFDNLKQAVSTYSSLFIVDAAGRLYIIPIRDTPVPLADLQASRPVSGLDEVAKVSSYWESYDNTSYETVVILKTDGTIWRGHVTADVAADLNQIPTVTDAVDLQRNIARVRNGELWTWNIRNMYEPSTLPGAPGVKMPINRSISRLGTHRLANLAVDTDGRLWFWGRTVTGVSDGTVHHEQPAPVRFSGINDVREAYIAEQTLFALTKQNVLYATSLYREFMPTDATFEIVAKDVRSVQAGSRHVMMERLDGSLWGWGVNKAAELGVGDFTFMYDKPVPLLKPISVQLNGQPVPLNSGALLRDGQAFIPLRSVFERLGASLSWDERTKETSITGASNSAVPAVNIRIRYSSGEVTVQGQTVDLPSKPFIIGGVSYVPLRFVSESLGADVHWSSADRAVQIAYPAHKKQ